jgi:hypothetical protein
MVGPTVWPAAGEPVHFIMQTRQFHDLRGRVSADV